MASAADWADPPTRVDFISCCFGGPGHVQVAREGANGQPTGFGWSVPARDLSKLLLSLQSKVYYVIDKTFNNGSLGSGIDEERSEMR